LPGFIKRHAEVFRISIFEGMGTMILTYGICCGQYLPPFRDKVTNLYYGFFISCSLFLALCWSGAMTGGHINPAVTLGQMFRSPKVSLRTGLIYMVSQFIGAFFGALFGMSSLTKHGFSMMQQLDLTVEMLHSSIYSSTSWEKSSALSCSYSSSS
jgi:glycerol uptake facilitator-like aquaporin